MSLQDIITNRENQEEELGSNYDNNDNLLNNNNNIDEPQTDEKEEPKLNLKTSTTNTKNIDMSQSNYLNTRSNQFVKETDNNIENNNIEHNIENNNIDHNIENNIIDSMNYNNNDENIKTNNNFNFNENNENNNIKIEINNNNQENQEKSINNNNNEKKEKIPEKDIIDELIEKIRNKQDLGIQKENPNITLSNLGEELKLGLQQLNQIKTKSNNKTILDTQNELKQKNFEKNKKYNEVISELSKTLSKAKSKDKQYKVGTYFDYKNIKILKPRMYFQTERKKNNIFELSKKNDNNRIYFSTIDGRAIIDGERKDLNKKYDNMNMDRYNRHFMNKIRNNNNINIRRSYSNDRRYDNFYPDFGNRKVQYYNKNFFNEEINRINKLLFS